MFSAVRGLFPNRAPPDRSVGYPALESTNQSRGSKAKEDAYDRADVVVMGIIAGFGAGAVYPLLAALHTHDASAAALAASFGPLLAAFSWGLREFITLDRRRLTADLASASNILAGALVTTMFMVQLAVKARKEDPAEDLKAVWLGLDVAWDVYLGLGTILFALSAMGHPRLGWALGLAGLLTGVGLLGMNFWTFPTPPADEGLMDLGPLVGVWYVIVTVMMLRSLAWVRATVQSVRLVGD